MCEVGIRVATVRGSIDGSGAPAPENVPGIVVGHLGTDWAVVVTDDKRTYLVPDGRARRLRQPGQKPGRSRPRREPSRAR